MSSRTKKMISNFEICQRISTRGGEIGEKGPRINEDNYMSVVESLEEARISVDTLRSRRDLAYNVRTEGMSHKRQRATVPFEISFSSDNERMETRVKKYTFFGVEKLEDEQTKPAHIRLTLKNYSDVRPNNPDPNFIGGGASGYEGIKGKIKLKLPQGYERDSDALMRKIIDATRAQLDPLYIRLRERDLDMTEELKKIVETD